MSSDAQQQVRQLQQQLAAREQEVAALREIAEAATELQSQDVQAAKVIELSKKNRSLNLMLEKERQKVAKLQQSLSQASAGKEAGAGKPAEAKEGNAELEALTKEVAAGKEKVAVMTKKIGQLEAKVFLLEGENRKLVRALVREVGEEMPLAKVVDEGSDWKGRREQIIHLKDTIKQLREAAAAGSSTAAGAAGLPAAASNSSLAKHESAHRSVIGKLNKERGAEFERMVGELAAAHREKEQLRLQYAGAASRRKVLEAEVVTLKDKLAVVLGKTQNDDKLIAALRSELAMASSRGQAAAAGSAAGRAAAGGGMPEVLQLRSRCSQLEEQVEQQQKIIRYLQAQQGGPGGERIDQLQDENEELRQQLAALQDDLEEASRQRPGTSGMSSALRQQVLTLQEDNNQLRQQLLQLKGPQVPTSLHLTESQQLVLEEAAKAVLVEPCSELDAIDEAEAVEDGAGLGDDMYLQEQQAGQA
ncbi:hypothetical protein OEZ85_012085 [Tetradesmus obliquus]|uniref:Uncharacterized protein n=1 Tax=Tetradesmus obliquus TaxID=3088 RepID=A0ABY8TT01_TETOB|nr:hypothetical protein OEZ85_012085 [Tetradesmus obliquus]